MVALTTSWKTLHTHTIASKITFQLQGRYTSQSIANNTTAVEYRTRVVVSGSGNYYESYGISSYINGTHKSIGHKYFGGSSTTVLQTLSITITHAANGTYNGSVTTKYSCNYGNDLATTSVAITLPTIPRGSSISAVSATIGKAVTISITTYADVFYHTISYAFGNIGKTKIADISTTTKTYSWTPPASLAAQIPKVWSGTGTVYVDTYSDSARQNLIETKTAVLTVAVPSYSMNIGTISVAGVDLLDGNYVQGISRANVTATANTSFSASITSYSVNNVSGTNGSAVLLGVFTSSSANTITIKATDSRGVSVTKSATVTVEPYTSPTITSFVAYRVASSGSTTESDEGTWVYLRASESHASVNGANTATMAVRLSGGTMSSGSISEGMWYSGINADSSYTATVTVTDSVGNANSRSIFIATTQYIIDIKADGKGVAFGKTATEADTVGIGWNARFDGALLSPSKTNTGDTRIFIIPQVPYHLIEPGHETQAYLKNLLKWICQNYPNVKNGIFIGFVSPNSSGLGIMHIVDTNIVNEDGYPRYATGMHSFYGTLQSFGFSDYVWNFAVPSNAVTKDAGILGHMSLREGYLGFDQAQGSYLRTPTNGLLPNTTSSGGYIGTSAWQFTDGYFSRNLYVGGKSVVMPVNSVVCTYTNSAPTLPGTWVLIDKGFKAATITGAFAVNTTNCKTCTVGASLADHAIKLKIVHENKTAIGDTQLTQGKLTPTSVGVTALPVTQTNFVGVSDGGNAMTYWSLGTDGVLYSTDRDSGGNTMAAGSTTYMYVSLVVRDYTTMLDSFCDKFYWRRTA